MSQRDSSTIHVCLLPIKSEFLLHREILSREGFIHFHDVDLIQRKPSLLQRSSRRWDRSAAHDAGIYTGNAPAHQTSQGPESALLGFRNWHQHNRRSAIDNAAGVSCGDGTFLTE